MIQYTNRPSNTQKGWWFIGIYFRGNPIKFLLLFLGIMYTLTTANGQCPDNSTFKSNIAAIYDAPKTTVADQLKQLINLKEKRDGCKIKIDSAMLFLLQKIGVLYSRQGNYFQAIDYTNQSIALAKEGIKLKYYTALILVDNYYNLYYYYSQINQQQKKYSSIDSCIQYAFAENSKYELLVNPLNDKSEFLFNKGAYDLCSKTAVLGEEIIQKYYHGIDSIQYIVNFVTRQGNALYLSKNLIKARDFLEAKTYQFEQKNNSNQAASFYILLGLINRDLGNYKKSFNYFKKGFTASTLAKFKDGCTLTLVHMGMLYAKNFNNPVAGLRNCFKALYFCNSSDSLYIFKQIATIYVLKDNYDSAQYYFQQAYNSIKVGMNETLLLKNDFQFPDFNQLQRISDLTTSKGDAYLQQFYFTKNGIYLAKALEVYKKNDFFLAKIKIEQQLQISANLVWRGTARNLYEHAIEACYNNNNIEDAFYFFEKSRSILLNDQINEQSWMEDTDIAQQSILKQKILALEKKLTKISTASAEYLPLQNKLNSYYEEQSFLMSTLKNKIAIYNQHYSDQNNFTLQQLKSIILKDNKTLIEIFSGDSAVYVLRIANNQQTLTKINPALYDSVTKNYTALLSNAGNLNKNYTDFLSISHRLFLLLFGTNPVFKTQLIISPDGKGFPFEALVTNENQQQPDYLLHKVATSYTYSIKYLTNKFTAVNNNTILGFAPVTYSNSKLPALFGSELSLNKINNYYGEGKNYINKAATKNNFLQNFPAYSIIQLYTHAADSSADSDPIIYFSDSSLLLSELFTDRKPATQLVVLSACETAAGKLFEGEGIFSFNRGFAALGIPAAVSNLWPVDNISTYKITELFYTYLALGLPTDIALQKAKITFINTCTINEKKLPYYWAGTILTGKSASFPKHQIHTWKIVMALLLGLVLLGYCIKKLHLKQVKVPTQTNN